MRPATVGMVHFKNAIVEMKFNFFLAFAHQNDPVLFDDNNNYYDDHDSWIAFLVDAFATFIWIFSCFETNLKESQKVNMKEPSLLAVWGY